MYPVIPLDANQFAAEAVLYLFTAVSAVLGVIFSLR